MDHSSFYPCVDSVSSKSRKGDSFYGILVTADSVRSVQYNPISVGLTRF